MPHRGTWAVAVAVVVLGGLGAAVAVFSSWPRRAPEPATEPAPVASPPAPAEDPVPEADGETLPAATGAASARSVDGARPPESGPPETEAAIDRDVLLDGTVVLVGDAGEERRSESGSILLRVFPKGGARTDISLAVVAGRFSASVPRASDLEVSRIELGDAIAVPIELPQYFSPPRDGALAVRARAVPSFLLHVLDAETREPLHDVTVSISYGSKIPVPAAAHDVLASGSASPVRLAAEPPLSFRTLRFWVSAAGYAWTSFELAATEAETTVLLRRGGELLVSLANYRPILPEASDEATRLQWARGGRNVPFGQAILHVFRILDPARTQFLEVVRAVPDPSAPTRVAGLEPGAYRVTVDIESISSSSTTLGSADATVSPGAVSDVGLALLDVPVVSEPVPLAGTLHVPAGWGPERVPIVFRPQDVPGSAPGDIVRVRVADLEPVPGDPTTWRWDAGLVRQGRYAVVIGEFSVEPPVELGESGNPGLSLALPEPADVTLRIVAAEGGGDVELNDLWWSGLGEDGSPTGRSGAVRVGPTRLGRCRFRCPSGAIAIFGPGRGVDLDPRQVTLVPGENEVTIRATLSCGLTIILQPGEDRAIDAPLAFTFSVRRADGSGPPIAGEARHVIASMPLPEPGDYEVLIDPIGGFEAPEPMRVAVGAGEWKDIEIRLRREGTKDGE